MEHHFIWTNVKLWQDWCLKADGLVAFLLPVVIILGKSLNLCIILSWTGGCTCHPHVNDPSVLFEFEHFTDSVNVQVTFLTK